MKHFSGILKRGILKSSFHLPLKPVLPVGCGWEQKVKKKVVKGSAGAVHSGIGSGLAGTPGDTGQVGGGGVTRPREAGAV